MVMREYGNLVEKGFAPAEIPFNNTMPVLWVEDDSGVVIAVLVYYTDKPRRTGYQVFIYVDPSHRNKGVGQALVDEGYKRILEEGGDRVIRMIHSGNKLPLSVIKGSVSTMVRHELKLHRES